MTELRVTTCDRCNPSGSLDTSDGRGYVYMAASEAVRYGWAREPGADVEGRDDTHYCLHCLDEEEAASPSFRATNEGEDR